MKRLLEVDGLSKSFAGRAIFSEVSFAVDAGEAVAIVGPSGSGKTTLLRCLDGLDRADAGTVAVGPHRLDAALRADRFQTAARALRRSVGFVFQGCHLFSHRTVLENVMEGPVYVRRETIAAARERADGLLETVGIHHRASALPRELSGGEQQRAAIARALAMKPEVLLLDEPTSALDPARTDALAELLLRLVGEGLAIVVVTHDHPLAEKLARRRFAMDGGRLSAV
ncbi:MAG TPA: ATP-binding cassette domain-containing protein [Polyangia bacterium]|nr:ATP-binding cassette domain-containing protein [Polyangia bacterium]